MISENIYKVILITFESNILFNKDLSKISNQNLFFLLQFR